MKGVRELKRRLRGVKNIRKITKAMEMVAATKLRRLQERALATRPYAAKIEEMIRRVAPRVGPSASPLLAVPEGVEDEALVVVGADRGLCGSYNSNLFRAGARHAQELRREGVRPHLFIIGRRPQIFFGKLTGIDIAAAYPDSVEKIDYPMVKSVLRTLSDGFLAGGFQRVRILYTRMKSALAFEPIVQDLLPLRPVAAEGGAAEAEAEVDYIFEPSPARIMERLLPRFLEMQLYAAVLESLASEFAARRMAMKNATDNADEMTGELTMEYNKARQAGITGDLMDIVGGTVALAG